MTGRVCQRVLAGVRHPAVALAWRDMGGTTPGLAAWALVTGVAMVKAGLSVPLAVFMTLAVYAGSAQLAVLPLLVAGAPLWVVWFTALCVNLRFVILSSLWRSYFDHLPLRQRLALGYFSGDVIFVAFTQRYTTLEKTPEQLPYFWGCAAINWLSWQVGALAGIFLAHLIPLEWGLGFAGVLALLGVLYSMVKDRATSVATAVAAAAAVAAFGLPLKLNILVAIAAAIAAGLLMETAQRRVERLRPSPAIRPPDPSKGERHPVLPLPREEAGTAPVQSTLTPTPVPERQP